jgi:hypothetical protein
MNAKSIHPLGKGAFLRPFSHVRMFNPHMLTQIAAVTAAMSTPRTMVRFLLRVNPFMRLVLCYRRRCVIAEATFVTPLPSVGRLMVLELFLCAKCLATWPKCSWILVRAVVRVVLAVYTRNVPVELAAVLEGCVTIGPAADECMGI